LDGAFHKWNLEHSRIDVAIIGEQRLDCPSEIVDSDFFAFTFPFLDPLDPPEIYHDMFEMLKLDLFEIDVPLREFGRVLRGVPVKRRVHVDLQRVHIISIQNPRRVDAILGAEDPRCGQPVLAVDAHLEPRLGIVHG
jgi:hypothetical protein